MMTILNRALIVILLREVREDISRLEMMATISPAFSRIMSR
ncbi:hypothetical protein H206_05177 [Candidatus Electrothrix aarhusensis]|uniref:Uncharacterized protein n=1 Tax=Candidatus Electrothrix aarhusensis TaxID=1859131 RepID=A0A3S3RAQ9_9BACT|nr:hypothetical protein H206_05177 [Candidatus Electrothrix aarhusensis]